MTVMSEDQAVEVYSLGVCAASVCASNQLTAEEVVEVVNRISPTGISSEWQLSKDTHFAVKGVDGQQKANGCPCEQLPNTRRHWLLEC